MKKVFAIVLCAAALLLGTRANAQLSLGAGWINSTERSYIGNNTPDKYNYNGFYAGAQFNILIAGDLGLAPGLYVSMLFGKANGSVSEAGVTFSADAKYKELALNIPVNITYAFEVGDFEMFAYAGPVFQYGLTSKDTGSCSLANLNPGFGGSATTGDITYNEYTGVILDKDGNKIDDMSTDPVRSPFNIYIGGGIGINIGSFQVVFGYDHSILNASRIRGEKLSRSQVKIGVGYAF